MKNQNCSVMVLLAYCFSTTLAAALSLAVLLAAASFAFGPSMEASASNLSNVSTAQEFSGMITDSRCGARHLQASGKSPAECARNCVRHGAKYALVDGDASYVLTGNESLLESLAGSRARVTGYLEGDVLTVTAGTVAPQ